MITDEELKRIRATGEAPAWTEDPATGPQVNYIKGLIESREVPETWLLRIKELTETGLTKGVAGKIISELKKLPYKPREEFAGQFRDRAQNNPTVLDLPVGRYAVRRNPGEDNEDIAFFRVKERTNANGVKYKIILTVAGPNEHLCTGPFAKMAVKQIVRAGVGDSAVLYGQKVGKCAICHTRITNRLSRELGIGPVCGGRVYADWQERRNTAETSLRARGLDPREVVEDVDYYGSVQ